MVSTVKATLLILFISFVTCTFSSSAEVYSWSDEEGNIHYSTTPPAESGAKEYNYLKAKNEELKPKVEQEVPSALQAEEQKLAEAKLKQQAAKAQQQALEKKHMKLCKLSYYRMGSYLPTTANTLAQEQHPLKQEAQKILDDYQNLGMHNFTMGCKEQSLQSPKVAKAIHCFSQGNEQNHFSECLIKLIEAQKQNTDSKK